MFLKIGQPEPSGLNQLQDSFAGMTPVPAHMDLHMGNIRAGLNGEDLVAIDWSHATWSLAGADFYRLSRAELPVIANHYVQIRGQGKVEEVAQVWRFHAAKNGLSSGIHKRKDPKQLVMEFNKTLNGEE